MEIKEYINLIAEVKEIIKQAQIKTVLGSNKQMLLLYWKIGNIILQNQNQKGWGAKIIQKLSADLKKEVPLVKGFSERNLKYMRKFSENYTIAILTTFEEIVLQLNSKPISQQVSIALLQADKAVFVQPSVALLKNNDNQQNTFVQQPVAQMQDQLFVNSILSNLTWSHHIILMDKLPHLGFRLWYMLNTIENGISRNILSMQIESKLFERQIQTNKISNFQNTLPPTQSDFAHYLLKDPYIFDFVQAKDKADERDIESQLTSHIIKFLLELGQGFAFIGRQVKFEIGNQDFYADLIFYHTKLHCHVVVELKARPFEPGDPAQLNFYVNIVNDKLKTIHDNDTIGLLLCKGKNDLVAEYSLKGYKNAIGVSDYQLSKAIPEELKSSLPQIEDIENELKNIDYNAD